MRLSVVCLSVVLCVFFGPAAQAESPAPWGMAEATAREYSGQKVVYDVAVESVERLSNVLDRASYLSVLNGADPFENSIVLVLHGNEIPFFAIKNFEKYKELMVRAQSLTVGGTIAIKMCRLAARNRGLQPQDIHGFVELVPIWGMPRS